MIVCTFACSRLAIFCIVFGLVAAPSPGLCRKMHLLTLLCFSLLSYGSWRLQYCTIFGNRVNSIVIYDINYDNFNFICRCVFAKTVWKFYSIPFGLLGSILVLYLLKLCE